VSDCCLTPRKHFSVIAKICYRHCTHYRYLERMYALSPSKSIKGSNYREFLKDKNVLLCTRLYKYAPNLESLLIMTYTELQISCVFAFFTLWKRVKTHVLSDQSVHITHTYCCVSKLSKFGAYLYCSCSFSTNNVFPKLLSF
jgi:hypothetical protein